MNRILMILKEILPLNKSESNHHPIFIASYTTSCSEPLSNLRLSISIIIGDSMFMKDFIVFEPKCDV
jgi:hypothetical protein